MAKQIYNPIIGKITAVEFLKNVQKKDGSGSLPKYKITLNGDTFEGLGEDWEKMVGEEKEWSYVDKEWTDKVGTIHYGKTLYAPLPPRKSASVAKPSERQILDEGKLIKQIAEQVAEIYEYVKSRK